MRNKLPKNYKHSERGNAALVAMVILGAIALTTLTLLASSTFRNTRNLDKGFLKVTEKWEARSQVNMLAAIISKDAPAQLETDVRFARERCNVDFNLPIFDPDDLVGIPISTPAVTFDDTTPQCASLTLSASSIFGKFDNWRDGRLAIFKQTGADRFNLNIEKVNIIEMTEIYRRKVRSGTSNDTAYAARYIVEAQFGNYRTRTNGEIILGSSIPGCGTTVAVEIVPSTVERGNPVEMNIAYTYASSLQISDASGTILHTETVTEQSTSQTFVYRFTPAVSGSYRVVATGSGSCSAQSALVPVTVTNPPAVCPRILNFSASSNTVNAGESVTISWNVADAFDVKLEDVPVASVGSQLFTITATRTFTLTARDAANTCPITQTLTVTVNPAPACAFGTPQIGDFSANPASVTPGANSTLSWNVSGLATGGVIRLTGNGLDQSVNASGTQSVTLPNAVGDYTYILIAENICPDGTHLTSQRQVVISVRACPPPVIDTFTVSPATVTMGGNQLVSLAWSISGTVDAVSISNGVGSGLPASGTVDISQPQTTTTYTITAVGCGQSRQMQVTVTVTSCPIPVINSFTATPNSVIAGGNQTVRLMWDTANAADSISIDNGIGVVTGNTFIDIPQPQSTTTYTISVVGCGQSVTRQVTVVVNTTPALCQPGQHLVAANRSIANAPAIFPYQSSRLEISARADFYEPTQTIKFNFEILAPAPFGSTDPNGYETLGYAGPLTGGNGFVEVGKLRFYTLTAPPRVAVYENVGIPPGRFITTIPLNYSGGNGYDYFSINGNALGSLGVDIPYTFDNTFDPLADSLIINSRSFPVYEINTNGGGSRFNAINQIRTSRFGCVN